MEHFRSEGNQSCILHAQDQDRRIVQISSSTTTKVEIRNEGSSKDGDCQTISGRNHLLRDSA
jgi:hypothetical protein